MYISAYLTDEQKLWFVNFFKQMCRVGLSEKNKPNNDKDVEKESPTKDEVIVNNRNFHVLKRRQANSEHLSLSYVGLVWYLSNRSWKNHQPIGREPVIFESEHLNSVIAGSPNQLIMSPTEGEGDILFLVRILLASASVSAWHFFVCTISHEPVGGF